MEFIEFIRSKGFTTKSLSEKAGVSARSLECYTGGRRSEWRNARLWFALVVSDALAIDPKKLLEFDGGEKDGF